MQAILLGPELGRGSCFQKFLAEIVGNWKWLGNCALALREQNNLQNAMFCQENIGKNHNEHAHLTHKDVKYLRNGWVHG